MIITIRKCIYFGIVTTRRDVYRLIYRTIDILTNYGVVVNHSQISSYICLAFDQFFFIIWCFDQRAPLGVWSTAATTCCTTLTVDCIDRTVVVRVVISTTIIVTILFIAAGTRGCREQGRLAIAEEHHICCRSYFLQLSWRTSSFLLQV